MPTVLPVKAKSTQDRCRSVIKNYLTPAFVSCVCEM